MENSQLKRACALVRVSTEEQARGGYGLKFQEEDIIKFCERNNLELLRVFRDEGFSGSTANRPGFQEMMAWAREKRFDVLVVWKLDRLFRDTKLTLQTVDELVAHGIEFRSVQESFTHDSNGRFLLTIFAAGAEKERKDIALRMYAGRTAAAMKGTVVNGGSIPPYGYRYNPNTKRLKIDEKEASIVRKVFRWLVDEKLSLYKVQARLNELHIPTKFDQLGRKKPTGSTGWWHKRAVGRMLSNEVYIGQITIRKYRNPGRIRNQANLRPKEDWIAVATPPIISKQLFEQAQDQLKRNAENSPRRTKNLYLLNKLLVCGHDGRRMQAQTIPTDPRRNEHKYYFCSAIRKNYAATRCPSRRISETRLAPPIWDKLKELLSHPATVLQELAEYQRDKTLVSESKKQMEALERKMKATEERTRRLVEVYVAGAVEKEYYAKDYRRLQDELSDVRRDLRKVKTVAASAEEIIANRSTVERLYERYRRHLEGASDQQKREIFHTFIKTILVRNEDVEIEVTLPHPDTFAGQESKQLSRKDVLSLFLKTRLLSVSEVASVHGNRGRFIAQKRTES